jgi:type VI secretion system secreted protein Hcp
MPESVALFLKAKKTGAIQGDSSQTSLGREKSIECLSFEHEVTTARETASGAATGRRTYVPIKIRKRIDRASPLIAQALVNNEEISGKFMFFRPSPVGDGTTQQFYTIEISQGRIASLKQFVPDSTDDEHAHREPEEEVAFTFHKITWTYTDGGVTAEDSWSQNV